MSVGKTSANKSGFSLFELLVVMTIIGLMSSLMIPYLTGSLGRMNLKTAAKSIAASLRYARTRAASEKAGYLALFDFEKNRLSISNEKDSEDIKTYQLPEGVYFKKARSAKANVRSGIFQILFFPNGSGSGGEVILSDEHERQYAIRVHFITGVTELVEM